MTLYKEEIKRTVLRLICKKKAVSAIAYLKEKLNENPKEPIILQLYGDICTLVGHTDAAIYAYQRNIKQFGLHYAPSYFTLGKIYESRGCIDEAAHIWRQALEHFTLEQYSIYLQALLKSPTVTSAQLLEEHQAWAKRFAYRNDNDENHEFEPYDGRRKIRIGYSCPFFISSTIDNQLLPIIRKHDRTKFKIFFYWTDKRAPDQYPNKDVCRLKKHADIFRDVGYMDDQGYVRQIRSDQIDILVEIAGFSPGHRFSAMAARCAPVQISYLNHTGTSGITNVDYVLADDIALRKDEDEFYTEKAYRLPGSFFCFNFEKDNIGQEPGPPAFMANNYITFGCFGGGSKYNPQLIKLWCDILHRVPGSRMLIRNNELSYEDNRKYMMRQFIDNGISSDRLFIMKGAHREEIIRNHNFVDISLDTWPYCGGNTLAESLWHGVPVISYYDKRFSSTYGGSLLNACGCDQLIAQSVDEYIEKAVALAHNRKAIADYRKNLRSMVKANGFNDAQAFAEKLEIAYTHMLRKALTKREVDTVQLVLKRRQSETLQDLINESQNNKMLTICMMARNDDYCGNFLYRLQTSLNYIAHTIKKLDLQQEVEILIADWNSNNKLGNDLQVSPDAAKIIKFIHVPPEEAIRHNPPGKEFNTALSQNVALRRASGRFLMFMPSDILFPIASLRNLIEILYRGGTEYFQTDEALLLICRKFISWQFIAQDPDIESVEKFLSYNSWQCTNPLFIPGLNAHMGAMVMSRGLWHQIQGVDESLTKWGWSDIELGLRINQKFKTVVLSHYGIFCYEMDSDPKMRSKNLFDQNQTNISPKITANDPSWGIADRRFETYKISSTRCSKIKKSEKLLTRRELLSNLSKAPRLDRLIHIFGAHKLSGPEWPAIYLLASVLNEVQPQYYLDYGSPDLMASYVVPADQPSVYYFSINNDGNGRHLSKFVEELRDRFNYCGHFHLIGGDKETAIIRLMDSVKIADALDLVYYLPDNYPKTYLSQLDLIVGNLSKYGAIVLTTKSVKTYSNIVSHIDIQYPECIMIKSDKYRTLLFVSSEKGGQVSFTEQEREEKYINSIIEAWDNAFNCPN